MTRGGATGGMGGLQALLRRFGAVGVGLAVLGAASFLFLSISGRVLGPAELAPLATLWVLINAVGPALFHPVEQEVGRSVAARTVRGEGAAPVVRRAAGLATAVSAITAVVLAVGHRPLADAVFAGNDLMVLSLAVGIVGLAAEHLTRGIYAGSGKFPRYGAQLAADGVLRIGSAALLAWAGVSVAGPYGVFLGLAPVLAVLLTAGDLGPARLPGPPQTWRALRHALGWLVVGAVANQFLVNAAPVAANLVAGPGDEARAGIFIGVLVLTRIPLFLFAAVQASFLPGLAAAAARGDRAAFAAQLRVVGLLVVVVGGLGVAVVSAVGPWVVTLVYGPAFPTTRSVLVPLALATAAYMVAAVAGQTLVAVQAYRTAAAGWAVGVLCFLVWIAVPLDLEARVGGAFLVGSAAAAVALAWLLRRQLLSPAGLHPSLPEEHP